MMGCWGELQGEPLRGEAIEYCVRTMVEHCVEDMIEHCNEDMIEHCVENVFYTIIYQLS